MNNSKNNTEPDNTAVRTALWRALHVQVDALPHSIEDEIGLKLITPPPDWQQRPDMKFTRRGINKHLFITYLIFYAYII